MNTNSNTYTIIYATVLVVIVAAILAFVSTTLKDKQQRNVDLETKQNILLSVHLAKDIDKAEDPATYIEKEFSKYISESVVVDTKGNTVEGIAFKTDLKSQYDIMRSATSNKDNLKLPIFICTKDNGEKIYIFSVYGAGLWGPIWGYVSLKEDFNTVEGVNFGHKGETPGLGAEIATAAFAKQFEQKEVFENGKFTSVAIVKGGAEEGNMHQVDAISGGTITSQALEATISSWLTYYLPFIEKQKAEIEAKAAAEAEAAKNEVKEESNEERDL